MYLRVSATKQSGQTLFLLPVGIMTLHRAQTGRNFFFAPSIAHAKAAAAHSAVETSVNTISL